MILIKLTTWAVCTFVAGVLYHFGGLGDDYWKKHQHLPRWMFNTKVRDIGVSLIDCFLAGVLCGWNWWLILCFGLSWAALSSYYKKKGTDATGFTWGLTGFMYGLAFLPYALATHHYFGFAIRTLLLAITTAVWSNNIDSASMEEGGRGGLVTATIPLLII